MNKLVEYNGGCYCIVKYNDGEECKYFIIDKEDYDRVMKINKSWYVYNGVLSCIKKRGFTKYIYALHDVVMDNDLLNDKIVENITNNINDLRKSNLRIVETQNRNNSRSKRTRTVKLPENCGISSNDIPKCVYYVKGNLSHGDSFVIEIKKNGEKKSWRSSKSKKVSLLDKFIEIKKKLIDLSKKYPDLIIEKSIIENYTQEQINIMKEYNRILKLSDIDGITDHLIHIPAKNEINAEIEKATTDTKKYLETIDTTILTGKNHRNNLPTESKITQSMLPKYCYYKKETEKRGDCFFICKHPKIIDSKYWYTSTSKKISTEKKFRELKKKLKEIEASNLKPSSSEKKNTKKYKPKKKPTGKNSKNKFYEKNEQIDLDE